MKTSNTLGQQLEKKYKWVEKKIHEEQNITVCLNKDRRGSPVQRHAGTRGRISIVHFVHASLNFVPMTVC